MRNDPKMTVYQKFMRQNPELVNFDDVNKNYSLDENFIREFIDYFNLKEVIYGQDVSQDFIREFAKRIHKMAIPFNLIFENDEKFWKEMEDKNV